MISNNDFVNVGPGVFLAENYTDLTIAVKNIASYNQTPTVLTEVNIVSITPIPSYIGTLGGLIITTTSNSSITDNGLKPITVSNGTVTIPQDTNLPIKFNASNIQYLIHYDIYTKG
jgi:hypothetical protein